MSAMKKPAGPATGIELPYSRVFINDNDGYDHARMRAKQLVDLLYAIGGDDVSNLMWLAQQIADELVAVVKLVEEDARDGGSRMSASKKPAAPATAIELPYSRVFINKGDALDHAVMRTGQLVDLLSAIGGEGPSNLMWLAQQIADELVVVVKLVGEESQNGGAA